jgi:hypothetical protein
MTGTISFVLCHACCAVRDYFKIYIFPVLKQQFGGNTLFFPIFILRDHYVGHASSVTILRPAFFRCFRKIKESPYELKLILLYAEHYFVTHAAQCVTYIFPVFTKVVTLER